MTQHTPGPWKAGREDMQSYDFGSGAPFTNVYAKADTDAPVVVAKCLGDDHLDDKANARLIAAAPEMLALLQFAVNTLAADNGVTWLKTEARALLARIEGDHA